MPCVFIGYSPTQSGYLCLQPNTGRIYISRHVRFDESVFPFKKLQRPTTLAAPSPPTLTSHPSPPVTIIQTTTIPRPTPTINPLPPLVQQTGTPSSCPHPSGQVNSSTPSIGNTKGGNLSAEFSAESSNSPHVSTTVSSSSPSVPDQHHTPTPSTTPTTSESPSPPIPPAPNNNHPMVTRRKNNISKPNVKYNYVAALTSHSPAEPNTLTQALKDKRWRGSMSTEIDAFARNETYELVPCQPHYNVVGCRWIYKNKFNSNGTHRCCKSCLVWS